MLITRITRAPYTFTLPASMGSVVNVEVALLPKRHGPNYLTVWQPADAYDPATRLVTINFLAGPDADATNALLVPEAGGDLWAGDVNAPVANAARIDRITVDGGVYGSVGDTLASQLLTAVAGKLDTDLLDASTAANVNTAASQTAVALRAALVPFWKPAETVAANAIRVDASGQTIKRIGAGTTGASYDATEQAAWTIVSSGGSGITAGTVAGQIPVWDGNSYEPQTPVDATAADVAFTPTGTIAATDVQAALTELDAEKAAAGHSHAGGGATLKRKAAAESVTNSIVLQNDDELFFPVAASEVWIGMAILVVQGDTAADIAASVAAPAGATVAGAMIGQQTGSTNAAIINFGGGLGVAATDRIVVLHFSVLVGATPGNVNITWAQAVATASPVTVAAGSFLRAEKVA